VTSARSSGPWVWFARPSPFGQREAPHTLRRRAPRPTATGSGSHCGSKFRPDCRTRLWPVVWARHCAAVSPAGAEGRV